MKKIRDLIIQIIRQDKNIKNDKNPVNKNDLYPIIDEKLYTLDETAFLLRVSKNTLYSWSYQKRISKTKNGGKLCFTGLQIKNYLSKMEVTI